MDIDLGGQSFRRSPETVPCELDFARGDSPGRRTRYRHAFRSGIISHQLKHITGIIHPPHSPHPSFRRRNAMRKVYGSEISAEGYRPYFVRESSRAAMRAVRALRENWRMASDWSSSFRISFSSVSPEWATCISSVSSPALNLFQHKFM